MNHIELFAGCGGLSLGLESAGFDLFFANELSPMAAETFAYNLLNVDFDKKLNTDKVLWVSSTHKRSNINARLRENPQIANGLSSSHFSDLSSNKLTKDKLERSLLVGSIVDINSILDDPESPLLDILRQGSGDDIDLVSGGPPCQSFSLAGLRDHSNDRNILPWEFAKFVDITKPKIALLENVSGILRAFKINGKPYYAWFEVAKAFAKIGYIPLCLHVNAKYVGAAQNRPRFILIALRDDIYMRITKNSAGKSFLQAIAPAKILSNRVRSGEDPKYGSLPYFDIEKNPDFFDSKIFTYLKTHENSEIVNVRDAIDDLHTVNRENSVYVERINNIFENINSHKVNKQHNHDHRSNDNKVKARFRFYQIMTKLPKESSKEISKYLKTEGASGISSSTLSAIQKHWVLDLAGNQITRPSDSQLLELLSSLYTKKQTQRALRADLPAPAALSIPDDACHYHESVEMQRTLTVREMARIQSFPDWYEIKSKVTTGGKMRKFEVPQYTQIGNAVPPLLGLALGKVCKAIIELAE
tara:strand:- start:210 stop:1799 length:1590 start_codon:yes stop_codon:yes gene_type:complete